MVNLKSTIYIHFGLFSDSFPNLNNVRPVINSRKTQRNTSKKKPQQTWHEIDT